MTLDKMGKLLAFQLQDENKVSELEGEWEGEWKKIEAQTLNINKIYH